MTLLDSFHIGIPSSTVVPHPWQTGVTYIYLIIEIPTFEMLEMEMPV
jgi:hypothetical protein